MTRESLLTQDWDRIVARLGGAASLEQSARGTRAFLRARAIASAVDLLRLIPAYCLGERGLRSTAAWATAMGLADISNVALLQRLRRSGDWLALLVGEALAVAAPQASRGRLIRIIDATTVPKAGRIAKKGNKLWRIHSAFDLPGERFGFFELTDQQGGETLDRIPVAKGEIRIADRAYLQPDRIAGVLEQGADIVVRAGWRNARWLNANGEPVDLLAEFRKASDCGLIDRPIFIGRKSGKPLALRLVAVRKSGQAAEAARRAAGGGPTGAKGAPSDYQRNARRRGVGDPCDLARSRGLLDRRHSCPLSPPMADRARLHALEKPDRPQRTAGRRRTLRQALSAGPSLDHPSARAAHPPPDGLEDSPRWAQGLAIAA
jgi:hypothetical protein